MNEAFSQVIRFGLVGTVGFVVDLGSLLLTLKVGAGYFVGRIISFLLAVLTTWFLNRQFTFTNTRHMSIRREQARYLVAMSMGGIVNYAIYCFVITTLNMPNFVAAIGVACGSLGGMAVNFALAKWWVFKPN